MFTVDVKQQCNYNNILVWIRPLLYRQHSTIPLAFQSHNVYTVFIIINAPALIYKRLEGWVVVEWLEQLDNDAESHCKVVS